MTQWTFGFGEPPEDESKPEPDPELTADQVGRLLAQHAEQQTNNGLGELDEAKVRLAIEYAVSVHPHRADIEYLLAHNAGFMMRPAEDRPGWLELRVGYSDDAIPIEAAGRSEHIAYLKRAELVRGPQG